VCWWMMQQQAHRHATSHGARGVAMLTALKASVLCTINKHCCLALRFGPAYQAMLRIAGVLVQDAAEAHKQATLHGARSVLEPTTLKDEASSSEQVVSEVELYGDVVLRFVSGSFQVSCHLIPP